MTAPEYVIPPTLRSASFVPRQAPGRREPARVTAGAFRKAGLDVPENAAQCNAYQLSQRQGFPWSPAIDAHTRRRGSELLGGDLFAAVDCDTLLAVDHSVWMDGFRRLADLASEAGAVLDLSGCLAVRTPGDRDRLHGPGWHLWWRGRPSQSVRFGSLDRCPAIEIKSRATCPGSPGYAVRSAPDGELAMLPDWMVALAPPRPSAAVRARSGSGGPVWRRLEGLVDFLRGLNPGDHRNKWLHWAGCRCGEMIAAGDLDVLAAERVLYRAAEENGHVAKHGAAPTLATIRQGIQTGVAP